MNAARPTIVNVDDNPAGLYAKSRILKAAGFNVVEAGNGTDALRLVREHLPSLVLLDVQLPDISGLEVCRRIKNDPVTHGMLVLHISATYTTDQDQLVSIESGADIYLVEPVGPEELITVVRTLLRLRRTELGLAESEERLRLATEGSGIATWELDLRTGASTWSTGLYKLLGYAANGTATWSIWRERIHPNDVASVDAALQRTQHERVPFQCEHRVIDPLSGESRWLAPLGTVYADEFGEMTRIIGVVLDVSSRKRVEAESYALLAREHAARTQAEEVSRLKDQFLATLSHELRTPMSAVLGWLHLLRMGKLDADQQRQALDTIESNAHLQTQLIDDILDVSRIITGKLNVEWSDVDLTAQLAYALDSVRPMADAKNITLNVAPTDEPMLVRGDALRLQQVITNILANAIKFSPSKSRVDVSIMRQGERATVTVRDHGEGISAEMLPRIFERFEQADGSITRRHGGLGLGLAIARHLINLHDGTVNAASDGVGHGSEFTVTLPLHHKSGDHGRGESRAGGMPEAPPAPSSLHGARVLVVDDNEATASAFAAFFSLEGASVWTASGVAEALDTFAAHPEIQVVVSDIGMPDRDGYDLMRTLKRQFPDRIKNLVAIAVTGYARPEDRARALEVGFNAHLAKPFSLDDLAALVSSSLSSRLPHPH
jgi:PAS domain S-box-containing protein